MTDLESQITGGTTLSNIYIGDLLVALGVPGTSTVGQMLEKLDDSYLIQRDRVWD